ncbi:MAG TPA: excisionase family DNA-binding protein [Ktedonobacterales bacterium]|jgi:excisionase family DNA binding protein
MATQQQTVKLLLTPREAANSLGIGVTLLYELLSRNRIRSVKVGRLRRIPVSALEAYIASELEQEHGNQAWQ